jgi:hypothetical protein
VCVLFLFVASGSRNQRDETQPLKGGSILDLDEEAEKVMHIQMFSRIVRHTNFSILKKKFFWFCFTGL